MHHKRRRPKNQRAGCLMCKPWKANHAPGDLMPMQERRIGERGAEGAQRRLVGFQWDERSEEEEWEWSMGRD